MSELDDLRKRYADDPVALRALEGPPPKRRKQVPKKVGRKPKHVGIPQTKSAEPSRAERQKALKLTGDKRYDLSAVEQRKYERRKVNNAERAARRRQR